MKYKFIFFIFGMLPPIIALSATNDLARTQQYVAHIEKKTKVTQIPKKIDPLPLEDDSASDQSRSVAIGNVFRPLTVEKINSEPTSIDKLMQFKLIALHYSKANELAKILSDKQSGLLSGQGSVIAESQKNVLYIHDTAENLQQILQFIHEIDQPAKEILIKARLITIDRQYMKDLGVAFIASGQQNHEGENNVAGRLIIPIVKLAHANVLNVRLTALEQHGHAHVLASPELMTLNRHAAMIESGEEIPYQEQSGEGATSVAFKKAVMRLKVTPTELPRQRILLNLILNQDKVSSLVINGVPAIRTQQLHTMVRVQNQQTIVLGGIFEHSGSWQKSGVPGLDRIPLLGLLFQEKKWVKKRSELLIFVTPEIVG